MARLLITGSRTWDDIDAVRHHLAAALEHLHIDRPDEPVTLVSGAAPRGADRLCEIVWYEWGLPVETHPAQWEELGKKAGFVRNYYMVQQGADLCVAFIRDGSRGATHTADLAEKHGIPVWRIAYSG